MFTFNFTAMLETLTPKKGNKYFEPLIKPYENYKLPSPGEIRKVIEKSSRCSKCHFVIFDNYWTPDIEKESLKLCPTCGHKL